MLYIPSGTVLKVDEKTTLIDDLTSSFNTLGITDIQLEETYYIDRRSLFEQLTLVLALLTASADIATLALAIREFLQKHENYKEVLLETDSMRLKIKGDMSDKAIIDIVKETRKIASERK